MKDVNLTTDKLIRGLRVLAEEKDTPNNLIIYGHTPAELCEAAAYRLEGLQDALTAAKLEMPMDCWLCAHYKTEQCKERSAKAMRHNRATPEDPWECWQVIVKKAEGGKANEAESACAAGKGN